VAVTEALCARDLLEICGGSEYQVTQSGVEWFGDLGIDVRSLRRGPSLAVVSTGASGATISRAPLAWH
jgi:hypothetical protein